MTKILNEPKIITDFNNDPICILPIGFNLTDERWERLWAHYDKVEAFITHEELQRLFPDEPALIATRVVSPPSDPADE